MAVRMKLVVVDQVSSPVTRVSGIGENSWLRMTPVSPMPAATAIELPRMTSSTMSEIAAVIAAALACMACSVARTSSSASATADFEPISANSLGRSPVASACSERASSSSATSTKNTSPANHRACGMITGVSSSDREREPDTQDCRTTPQACQVMSAMKPANVTRLRRSRTALTLLLTRT